MIVRIDYGSRSHFLARYIAIGIIRTEEIRNYIVMHDCKIIMFITDLKTQIAQLRSTTTNLRVFPTSVKIHDLLMLWRSSTHEQGWNLGREQIRFSLSGSLEMDWEQTLRILGEKRRTRVQNSEL